MIVAPQYFFVRLVTGKTINLHVYRSETVQELKYQYKEDIPCDQQRLLLNGKELVDEKRLCDYYTYQYISENSTINLLVVKKGEIQIDIIVSNKHITLQVAYSDTVEKVKAMINDNMYIPSNEKLITFDGTVVQDNGTLGDYLYNSPIPFTFNLYASSTLCPLIMESMNYLSEKLISQNKQCIILEKKQIESETDNRHKEKSLKDNLHSMEKNTRIMATTLKEELHYEVEKLQQEQGMLITDLKLQLHIEMEKTKNYMYNFSLKS